MNGHERRQGGRLLSLLASAGAIAATAAFATSALGVATVELSTGNGAPGGTVKLTMSITGQEGDPAFAGAQVDMIIERAQLGIAGQCSESAMQCDSGLDCQDAEACALLSCDKDPRLPAALQLIANAPRFQNVPLPANNKRLRLGIVGPVIPVTTFEDGVVLTCDLDVPESAPLGLQNLSTDRLVVNDENGDIIDSQVVVIPGRIVEPTELTPAVTTTPTPTATAGTPPPTSTLTGGPTNTPTPTTTGGGGGTPTNTPTGVLPTATNTGTGGGTPTSTPTATRQGGGGGGGDGCDCAITPEADTSRGTALVWLSLLPVGLLWARRRQGS
jgi:hypothetical protein